MDEMERQRRDLAHCRAYHKQDLHSDVYDAVFPDDDPRNWWHGKSRQWVENQRNNCFD